MDTSDSTVTVSQILIHGEEFYLRTTAFNEGKEGFDLILTNGMNVWDGSVTEDLLDSLSEKRKIEFHSFVCQTKAALTNQLDKEDFTFEYDLSSQSSDSAEFVWKKHIVEEKIKFRLGSVKLKKMPNPGQGICQLLQSSIFNLKSQTLELEALQAENQRLSSERNKALQRLDKCVQAKEEMELDLYSKFVAVLNSKKQHIQHLLEKEESKSIDDVPDSPVASTSKAKPIKQNIPKPQTFKKRPASCSDDDTDRDTDGADSDSDISRPKRKRQVAPQKQADDSIKETSLNLGDDTADEETLNVPVARRPRKQAKNTKKTPSKPVLPRVSSGNTSITRSSRKPSLNKSGSENSNRSGDNLDPDDLLNNL